MADSSQISAPEQAIARFCEQFGQAAKAISQVLVGHDTIVENVLVALLAGGHVLLEGVPGLGKTLLAHTIHQVMGLSQRRIQFTPDLMPADILGTNVLMQGEGEKTAIVFEEGPVFANVVLADEINRATPRTQSALLQAMQEREVTVGGVNHPLPAPFMVIATQNPIEMEGTYPLPEAQLDRFFFKLVVPYPDLRELIEIARRTTTGGSPTPSASLTPADLAVMKALVPQVCIAEPILEYTARLVLATQPGSPAAPEITKRYVQYGASPRGMQALILGAKVKALLAGRPQVAKEDVQAVAIPALRHRLLLHFEAEADSVNAVKILEKLL